MVMLLLCKPNEAFREFNLSFPEMNQLLSVALQLIL